MEDQRKKPAVPAGKRVLNTHVSVEEHEYLRRAAQEQSMTVTMFLRIMIRREMQTPRKKVA